MKRIRRLVAATTIAAGAVFLTAPTPASAGPITETAEIPLDCAGFISSYGPVLGAELCAWTVTHVTDPWVRWTWYAQDYAELCVSYLGGDPVIAAIACGASAANAVTGLI